MKKRKFTFNQMEKAITHLPLSSMEAMTDNRDFITPFSYKDLFLYAKKGKKILITNDPKKVEVLFGRISWFETALPQIILQHKMGCLSESIQEKLTYFAN